MLSKELHKMFNCFSINLNNKDNEIRKIFKCFSASSNNRDDNYVKR